MSIIKKQLLAIKKVAKTNHSQSPVYFSALISEIDLKLREIEDEEMMESITELEMLTLEEIA